MVSGCRYSTGGSIHKMTSQILTVSRVLCANKRGLFLTARL